MLVLLAPVLAGLLVPIITRQQSCLPLDTITLSVSRSALEQCLEAEPRGVVGLLTPDAPAASPASCGVLCEISECSAVWTDELCLVRAIAFSRFRVAPKVQPSRT